MNNLQKVKILVVEDEEIIRSSLCKLLEHHGYQTAQATSVKTAREILNQQQFDLIISDMRLPGGVGSELIALADPVPVLIMTSYASLRSAVDTMRLGAVDYISKPFDQDELLSTVKRVLSEVQHARVQDAKAKETASVDHAVQVVPNKRTIKDQPQLSLDQYFIHFVQQNESEMSETMLAKSLGISRKSLWERRNKLGIPRKDTSRRGPV